jgi:hypothetical protein
MSFPTRTHQRDRADTRLRGVNQEQRLPQDQHDTHPMWHDVLQLQRLVGNQAVGRLLAQKVHTPEAVSGGLEPDQTRAEALQRTGSVQVMAAFRNGSEAPVTQVGHLIPKPDAIVARQVVGATGAPTVHAGGGNSCVPGTETLDWTVIDDGANWRADVTALNVSGNIHLTDWPSNPAAMTVPNTANAVDGGNINNTAGSSNHWQAAIADMADYDTAGGGAGPNWHSTAASQAHEWAHWNEDYLGDAIPGANWTRTNRDIDAMTVPKAAHADAAAARTALEPRVTPRFRTFVGAATGRWNTIIARDQPGGGGRGYAAGVRVLNGLIASIRTYAVIKGWAAPPPARGPAP